ncbi:MAG: hypothetical protein IPN84_05585 [Sphingomonadales bacterium]|jgi:hypothetical protein|nr:hypothetical protein [Sphingomonadales bacterium]
MNAWRNPLIGVIAGLVISVPLPAAQVSTSLEVATCAGGTVRIDLPSGGAPVPGGEDHDCCRKGCHAGSDRRKKNGTLSDSCC